MEKSLVLPGIELQSFNLQPVAIPTELSQVLGKSRNLKKTCVSAIF
jgi:hypothetical protein